MAKRILILLLVPVALPGCVEIANLNNPDGGVFTSGLFSSGGRGGSAGSVDPDSPVGPESPDAEDDIEALVDDVNAGRVGNIPPITQTAPRTITASGLWLFSVVPGDGEMPVASSTVEITYTGWRAEDGQLIMAGVNELFNITAGFFGIEGLSEGILTMREGELRRILIPPDLAFGNRGQPPNIPPRAVLVYDVELVSSQQ